MRSFILKVCTFVTLLVLAGMGIVCIRLLSWQDRVREVFKLLPETEIICMGSSHTGCTWVEREQYHNQVFWNSMNPIPLAKLRLQEIARLNDLSHVRFCMVDFDVIGFCDIRFMDESFVSQLPFTWRYIWDHPWKWRSLGQFVQRPGVAWKITDSVPADTVAWPDRTEMERREHLDRVYGGDRQQLSRLLADPQWCDVVLESVKELRDLCMTHHIHLVLFSSPVVSQSPDRTDPERVKILQEMVMAVRKMGVDYKDYRSAMPDSAFRDSNHLLQIGAERFTQRVFNELWSKRGGAL